MSEADRGERKKEARAVTQSQHNKGSILGLRNQLRMRSEDIRVRIGDRYANSKSRWLEDMQSRTQVSGIQNHATSVGQVARRRGVRGFASRNSDRLKWEKKKKTVSMAMHQGRYRLRPCKSAAIVSGPQFSFLLASNRCQQMTADDSRSV